MTTVSRGEITITNVNDGRNPYFHTAYAWSADGTDRFTTVYPKENLWVQSSSASGYINATDGSVNVADSVQKEIVSTFVEINPLLPYWMQYEVDLKIGQYGWFGIGFYDVNKVFIDRPAWANKAVTKDETISVSQKINVPSNARFARISFRSYGNARTKFEQSDIATIYTPSPSDDYANAYPTYIGTYSDYEPINSEDFATYTWSRLIGNDGAEGKTPYFHTAYTNSTDFGAYDYSGNPNLMPNLKASDFSSPEGGSVEQLGSTIKFTFTKTDGMTSSYSKINMPALLANTQYTMSVDATILEGYRGSLDNLRMYYRKSPSGNPVISMKFSNAVPGQKTKVFITANSSADTNPEEFDRMYLTVHTTSTDPFVGSVLLENIKLERGSTATSYQPNIKDDPWYFSTVPLEENILRTDIGTRLPITTTEYQVANFVPYNLPYNVGQKYTLTMKATKPATQRFGVYLRAGSLGVGEMKPVEGLADVWQITFTITQAHVDGNANAVNVFQLPQTTKGTVKIEWAKLEKGDARTPNIDDYKYLGNYTDFIQEDSLNPIQYFWSLIKGADGETSHVHTAYAWSADGTDRFTKVYPQVNTLENTKTPISSNPVRIKGSTHSNTDALTFQNGIIHHERKPNYPIGEMYYRFMSTANDNLASTNLIKGETYYFGLDLRAELAEGDYVTWRAQYKNSTSSWIDIDGWETGMSKIEGVTSEFKRFEKALTIPKDAVTLYFSYQVYPKSGAGVATGSIVEFKNAKFALKSATPYTPTPEEDYENAYPTYTGTYSDFNVEGSDDPKDYAWMRLMGNTGESAKTLILSTSSNIVKINQDSSIQSDTITLQANMQNMVGIATFSAIPYIGTTPQTAITLGGTGNTRTFSTSSWNQNWTFLIVTATFGSFIDKQTIISIKEGKDGVDSITGLLTNESVTLPADKNGIVESFSEASGTFKVFDGLSDVTGRNVVYTLKNKSGGTFNINASTGVYNMTEMSKDSAIAVFEATYKNIKIEKILSVAKSKAGKETYTYTKYSNSKDFGNYDYSGRPNLAPNLDFSKFSGNGQTLTKPLACFKDHETYLELDSSDPSVVNTSRNIYVPNCSALLPNNTYIMTVPIMINADFDNFGTAFVLKANDGTALGTALGTINPPRENVGTWQNVTKVFTVPGNLKFDTTYLQLWQPVGAKGKIYIGYDIKIEKVNSTSDTATPYQPNLLDEPWHLSTVPVGENIRRLDAGNQPPFTTTEYQCYVGRINGYWEANETYTVTINATKPATQTFGLYLLNGSQPAGNLTPVEGLTDTWSVTFKPTKEMIDAGVTNHANIFQIPQSTKGEVKVNWVKIEKGDTRTPNIDSYKYMGIYVGGESEQPHDPTQYAWSQIKGNDSTSYSLLLSSQVMSLPRGASKLVPENITISGMAQTGEKSIENINSRIVIEETTNGTTWTTKYDADALTYTYTPSSLNVLSARVKMYVAGAKNIQLDQKSINIVKDGSNGSNGSSSYTWVRYSENANGNPMTTTSNSKTKYIGIAITQTSTAPSAYSDYTWSRIKGSGGLVAKVYSNGGTNIEQSPIQINVETQSDGDVVEPDKVTWYMSKDSSVEWTAITAGNGITLNKKYIVVEPVVFLEANSISFKAQVEYNSMAAFDYMTVNNKSFDATKPLILRQPTAPLNPYPGLLWLDTSSGSGNPLDKTNPSLVYRWGKSAIESVIGTEYAHYAYANTPTGYQEDGVTPDPGFSVTYNSSQKPMYIGYCVTDTAPDPTTPSSYNWKSITTENGSEDVNGAKGIAQEKIETTYKWGWVVLGASDLEMLPWLNNEDGSTIIDWIYQITQKTSDDSIVQTVVGSEDMSKVYAKTDAVDELSSANHELSDKLEEYNKQMEEAFAGIDTTYVNKSEFEQEMNKFNFGIDKAGGVNLIRNSTGFQWEDTTPSDEMLTNPKFEGTISTTGLDNGWVYNDTGMGRIIGAENDLSEYNIMRIGGTNSRTKYSYSKNIPVTPGQLINISGQARIPNTIGNTQHIYVSIRFYGATSNPLANSEADTIGNGQGFIYLFTDKKHNAGSIFGTDSYTVKTNNIVQDIWSNYSVNVTIPSGAAFMKVCLYNSSTAVTDYFDFRKPSVVLYSGMFDFWHKNDSANAQIRQILGDESLEELGLIAGFELKGLRYKLDQDILLPNPNTEYTLSWYANKISQSGKSKYYVKVLNTKTGAEIAVSEASADTIGYQRMSVTFSVTNTSAVTIRIGLEGEGSANATLSAAGLMINIGPYPLSWQSHHEEVYSTNVRIDSSGLKVFNSDYDGYNVMTPREFAGYYRDGEVYERVFTLNKDTTKVKKLEAQERFMMKPVQIVSVDSPTIKGWAFVGYNGEDTD